MSARNTRPEGRYVVPALAQGLSVLGLFSRERQRLSAPQIAQELNLPRTTVFRLLHTLQAMGFVIREPDERHFRLGPGVLGTGFAYLASLDYVEVAQSVLARLRDETGMSVHMAVRDGADVVYVSRFAAHTTIKNSVTIGTRFPVHATIMGRMLILDCTPEQIEALYPQEPLTRYTEHTPVTRKALLEILAKDRKRGFAVSQSYFESGVTAVAAPVRDAAGDIVAAINVTSVNSKLDETALSGNIKDSLLAAAAEITRWATVQ